MFENLTLPHILLVLVIAMLLFGTKRIPEIAGSMGKGIREFKKSINDVSSDSTPHTTLSEPRQPTAGREQVVRADDEARGEPKRLI